MGNNLYTTFEEHQKQKERKKSKLKMKSEKNRSDIRSIKKVVKKKDKFNFRNISYEFDETSWDE